MSTTSIKKVEVVVLGTGAGMTHVYKGEPSSSFVVLVDGQPILLGDVGVGVVHAYHNLLPGQPLPPNIYISHNHTDHAGELPVVLAVEAGRGRRLRVWSHPDVMSRLKQHRLHELVSTGHALSHFVDVQEVPEQGVGWAQVGQGLSIAAVRTRHAELCYGAVVAVNEEPVLGWTADSGYDGDVYRALAAAPLMIVDARRSTSDEHAGFDEVARMVRQPFMAGKHVIITGYGSQGGGEAPSQAELKAMMLVEAEDGAGANRGEVQLEAARPGQRILVWEGDGGRAQVRDGGGEQSERLQGLCDSANLK